MDLEMTQKLEAVLEKVKEPESLLSIAQLGLVEKISYSAENKRLRVFLNFISPTHGCCTIMGSLLLSTTLKNLTEELQREFPDLSVEIGGE
jgi:metal-sulfur cluster biosynthetic enzyme